MEEDLEAGEEMDSKAEAVALVEEEEAAEEEEGEEQQTLTNAALERPLITEPLCLALFWTDVINYQYSRPAVCF